MYYHKCPHFILGFAVIFSCQLLSIPVELCIKNESPNILLEIMSDSDNPVSFLDDVTFNLLVSLTILMLLYKSRWPLSCLLPDIETSSDENSFEVSLEDSLENSCDGSLDADDSFESQSWSNSGLVCNAERDTDKFSDSIGFPTASKLFIDAVVDFET